ncbi:MAG: hypothetical protein KatS3mg065_1129 [Chloroflexota bacterium]|nr:MAG: hypothetical protein KatS3mg065_1129 [Chloroflexota bacterium]
MVHATKVLSVITAEDAVSGVQDVPCENVHPEVLAGGRIHDRTEHSVCNASRTAVASDTRPLELAEALPSQDAVKFPLEPSLFAGR